MACTGRLWSAMPLRSHSKYITTHSAHHPVRAESVLHMTAWVFLSTFPMRLAMIPFSTLNILPTLALLPTTSSPDSTSLLVAGTPYSGSIGFEVGGTATTSSGHQSYRLLDVTVACLAFLRRISENGNGSMSIMPCWITPLDTCSTPHPPRSPRFSSGIAPNVVPHHQIHPLSIATCLML